MDFTKVKMIRDALGSPIPQAWDEAQRKFVPLINQGNQENSNLHISTNSPSDLDGKDGDLWIKYTEVDV